MRKTISPLMAVLFFAATVFTSCKKEEANTCGNYDLNGTWVRQNDPGGKGSEGMQVTFSSTTNVGKVTFVPAGCTASWYINTQKWTGYDKSNCTMNDLKSDGTSYGNWSVRFDDANTFVILQGTSGDTYYKRK